MYAARFTQLPPLGLYIHMPWCQHKCPYCDFNSHVTEQIPEQAYIDALLEDLAQELPLVWGRRVETVFIGGGTPSLFSGEAMQRLMQGLRAYLNLDPRAEVTLESNPGSAERERYQAYREAGINRLSIGVQSFSDEHLKTLERVHDREQALKAFAMARQAGFESINLDLMFALPGQTSAQALADLQQALDLLPEHLSYYQLTLEPNTQFGRYPPSSLPDDDAAMDMLESAQSLLANTAFEQYEVSAYSLSGKASRHNLNYWHFGDYLGIGAGAHGKLSFADGRVERRIKHWQPKRYLQGDYLSANESLDQERRVFEFMLNASRLKQGFALELFEQATGLPRAALLPLLDQAINKNLIEDKDGWVRPTELGWCFLNDLQALFLPTVRPESGQIFVAMD